MCLNALKIVINASIYVRFKQYTGFEDFWFDESEEEADLSDTTFRPGPWFKSVRKLIRKAVIVPLGLLAFAFFNGYFHIIHAAPHKQDVDVGGVEVLKSRP